MRAFVTVNAGQTDANVVSALTGKSIKVTSILMMVAGTATAVTFNTKGSGAGTAVTPAWPVGANGGFVAPANAQGWFETNASEALTMTTGAGSATSLLINYDTSGG